MLCLHYLGLVSLQTVIIALTNPPYCHIYLLLLLYFGQINDNNDEEACRTNMSEWSS